MRVYYGILMCDFRGFGWSNDTQEQGWPRSCAHELKHDKDVNALSADNLLMSVLNIPVFL